MVTGITPGEVDSRLAEVAADPDTYQFPDPVRAVQAANLADPEQVEGAAVARMFATALNVLGYGVSAGAAPAANVATFRAAIADAKALGRALYIPADPFGAPIQLDERLDITGIQVRGDGRWSQLQATVGNVGIFYINGTDTVVEGVNFATTAPRGPTASTDWGQSNCAIYVEAGAHNTTIRNVSGSGMDSIVNIPTTTAVLTDGLVVDNVEAENVTFAVAGRGLRDAMLTNIRGTYSLSSTGGTPPHLIYIASDSGGGVPASVNVHVANVQAWDGSTGAAIKLDTVTGGSIVGVTARHCRGVLDLLNLTGTIISNVISLDDNGDRNAPGPVKASINVQDCEQVRITHATVKFANIDHTEGIWLNGSNNCEVSDVFIEGNCGATGSRINENESLCRIYGTNNRLKNITVTNIGNDYGSGFIFSGCTQAQLVDPRLWGNIRYGMYIGANTTATTIDYDPARITPKASLAGPQLFTVNGSENPRLITPAPHVALEESVAFISTQLRNAADWAGLLAWNTGQPVTKQGTWQWDAGTGGVLNVDGQSNGWCTIDSGVANPEIEACIVYGGAKAGLVLHSLGGSDQVLVDLQSTGVVIQTREASVDTALATSSAMTITAGRKYVLRVASFGGQIDVYLDGDKVVSGALSSAQQTKFAAGTVHGFHAKSAAAARWRWARIRSLS